MRRIVFAAVLAMSAATCTGGEIRVSPDGSGDYMTIQAAIDAAVAGDVIVLAEAVYRGQGNCNLDTGGKAVTIRSVDPRGSERGEEYGHRLRGGRGRSASGFLFPSWRGEFHCY